MTCEASSAQQMLQVWHEKLKVQEHALSAFRVPRRSVEQAGLPQTTLRSPLGQLKMLRGTMTQASAADCRHATV